MRLSEKRKQAKIRDAVLAAIPTNWTDSILTGPDAVFSSTRPATANIEMVLRAVKKRVAAIYRAAEGKVE